MPGLFETLGRIEELAPAELANSVIGTVSTALGHTLIESALDNYLKDKFPKNYMLYSTGITSAIFLAIAGVLYFRGRTPGWEWMQYIAGGIILCEIVQLLDLVHVSLTVSLRGE